MRGKKKIAGQLEVVRSDISLDIHFFFPIYELMASILFLLLLLLLFSISKVRATQAGACIFLPLFPVFPYQSEKVAATPTRETEIEV